MFYGGEAPLFSLNKIFNKVDIQSLFFATMFVIILLVLGKFISPPIQLRPAHFLATPFPALYASNVLTFAYTLRLLGAALYCDNALKRT